MLFQFRKSGKKIQIALPVSYRFCAADEYRGSLADYLYGVHLLVDERILA
jgi:hypothetical protein